MDAPLLWLSDKNELSLINFHLNLDDHLDYYIYSVSDIFQPSSSLEPWVEKKKYIYQILNMSMG